MGGFTVLGATKVETDEKSGCSKCPSVECGEDGVPFKPGGREKLLSYTRATPY